MVAVQAVVRVVECLGSRRGRLRGDRPVGQIDPDLVGLTVVAQVGRSDELACVRLEALAGQRRVRLCSQTLEELCQDTVVHHRVPRDGRSHVVVADIDGEQSVCRQVARVGRDQCAAQAQQVDQPAREQRAGTTEGHQREVSNVEATLDGDLAQRVGLVPRADLQDAARALLDVETEPAGQVGYSRPGGIGVQRDLTAEQVRRDAAQNQVCVGDRRLGARAITQRPRFCSGRLRSHLEGAFRPGPGDRTAARAHGDDVDHRDLAGVGTDIAFGRQRRCAVDDDRHVGRRAAAVEGDDAVEAGAFRDDRSPERAGSRSGQHRCDRLVDDLRGRQHAAIDFIT